jgi:hypothetical protein
MPYGYLGQNQPNQTVSNSGVFSITDVAELQSQGKLGGSLELIEEQTVSGVSAVNFTSIKENVYDVHFLTTTNFNPSDDDRGLYIRFYENGVEESGNVYQYAYQYGIATGTFGDSKTTGLDFLHCTFNAGTGTNEVANSYNYFYNLGNSAKYSFQTMHNMNTNTSTQGIFAFGGGVLPQASVVDQIKLYVTSGTFSATIKLYGVKQI